MHMAPAVFKRWSWRWATALLSAGLSGAVAQPAAERPNILGAMGALAHPEGVEQSSSVPDTPGWRYFFTVGGAD